MDLAGLDSAECLLAVEPVPAEVSEELSEELEVVVVEEPLKMTDLLSDVASLTDLGRAALFVTLDGPALTELQHSYIEALHCYAVTIDTDGDEKVLTTELNDMNEAIQQDIQDLILDVPEDCFTFEYEAIDSSGATISEEIELADLINFEEVRELSEEELPAKIDELNKLTEWAKANLEAPSSEVPN